MGESVKLSCIIPAHDEAKSIARVVRAVCASPVPLDEILVVDDHSVDGTGAIASGFPRVQVITNPQQLGKSGSVARGCERASGDCIILLDADLIGLQGEDVARLLQPILSGKAQVAISMRGNTPAWMQWIGIDFMSGERVLPRSLLQIHLHEIRLLHGFGLEVFLNRQIIEHELRVAVVKLENVRNDLKWIKHGASAGFRDEIRMWRDIFGTASCLECVRQNVALRKLLV